MEEMKRLEEEIAGKLKEKEEQSLKQKGFFKEQEDASRLVGDLDKEVFRLQSQKEKLEERMESQVNYM